MGSYPFSWVVFWEGFYVQHLPVLKLQKYILIRSLFLIFFLLHTLFLFHMFLPIQTLSLSLGKGFNIRPFFFILNKFFFTIVYYLQISNKYQKYRLKLCWFNNFSLFGYGIDFSHHQISFCCF